MIEKRQMVHYTVARCHYKYLQHKPLDVSFFSCDTYFFFHSLDGITRVTPAQQRVKCK